MTKVVMNHNECRVRKCDMSHMLCWNGRFLMLCHEISDYYTVMTTETRGLAKSL